LEAALAALLPLGWRRRTKVALASGLARAAAGTGGWTAETAGPRAAESAGTRTAKAAGPRGARSAGPWTAKPAGAAGPWAAEATARAGRASRTAVLACARLAHRQRATHEELTVELLDGRFGRRAVGVLHKGEAARSTRFTVERPDDLRWLTDGCEMRSQIFFGCLIRKVAYEKSDWWHGMLEEGSVRIASADASITKTL
jgi:hypothetical protein